ncbi:MAG: hypothetical protein DCC58_16575 [Chloroflexi bacterium]|nr:MAG: hypothetical protein DCC58_16575 [Chloroflexota bacterium]
MPWGFDPARDLPAWERGAPTTGVRIPSGYIDLLTWRSRRIRLVHEVTDCGVIVTSAVVVKGEQIPKNWYLHRREQMVPFLKKPKATEGENPYPPLSFVEDRALWRDSLALFQSVNTRTARPGMIDWLAHLVSADLLEETRLHSLTAYGLATDQGKVFFWRRETMPLPLQLINDYALTDRIEQALAIAERVGTLFEIGADDDLKTNAKGKKVRVPRPMQVFAESILAPGDRSPDPGDVARLVDALEPAAAYWPALEAPFKQFLLALPDHPNEALRTWIDAVEAAARAAFEATMLSFDTSARALRAAASAEERFRTSLAAILRRYRDTREEDAHAQPIATRA